MTTLIDLYRRFTWILAVLALFVAMGGTWMTSATANATPADNLVRRPATDGATTGATTASTTARSRGATTAHPTDGKAAVTSTSAVPPSGPGITPGSTIDDEPAPRSKKAVAGKLNLNTATEDQLMQLPQVGPAKAERIVTWRRKNGGFRRTADLRRVKGFGYKTFKRLEPLLDIRGETTLAPK